MIADTAPIVEHVEDPQELAASELGFDDAPTDQESALQWLAHYGLDACEYDDRSPVEKALTLVRPSVQGNDAACLAVNAAFAQLAGKIDQALDLYQRARKKATDPDLAHRVDENIAAIFVNRQQTAEAEEVVDEALAAQPEDPIFLGLRAVLRARRRDKRARADISLIEQVRDLPDLVRVRAYVRACHAAYEMGERAASEDFAYRAVQIAESINVNRQAALAYHNLLVIYSNDAANIALAKVYAALAADAAFKGGDHARRFVALVAEYALAAEAGDEPRAKELQKILEKLRGPARYQERFALLVSDSMICGWNTRYDEMRQNLEALDNLRLSGPQRALQKGLLSVAYLGCEDEGKAIESAHTAISVGKPLPRDSVFESRLRLLGRIIGAGVLLQVERKTEAARTLSTFQSHQTALSIRRLATALLEGDFDRLKDIAPDIFGYGLLFKSLNQAQEHSYRTVGLTDREIAILRLLAIGETGKSIAAQMGLTRVTIDWHKGKILKKLGVKRTIAAVAEARRLRIIT